MIHDPIHIASLDGIDVLRGFSHSIAAIFAEAQRPAEQV